jgi:microcystin-dependent protein
MYSGVWPPTQNKSYVSNMYNTECWILCDGGKSYVKPTTMPSGINNYSQSIISNTLTITFSDQSQMNVSIPDLRGRFVMGYTGGPTGTPVDFSYNGTITSVNDNTQKFTSQQLNQTNANVQYNNYPGGINNYGGVMSQVITTSEMPAHSHNMSHSHNAITNTSSTIGNTNVANVYNFHKGNYYAGQGGAANAADRVMNATVGANSLIISTKIGVSNYPTQQIGGGQYRSNLPPYWVLSFIMRIG